MSKPITKSQLSNIKANANGNETVLALIAEVERLQRLAKPNVRLAKENEESYGKKIWGRENVSGDGYSVNDPTRERY